MLDDESADHRKVAIKLYVLLIMLLLLCPMVLFSAIRQRSVSGGS
jgi:hypothetical protein